MGRIELPTSPLPRGCSTTEPHGHRHRFELAATNHGDHQTQTRADLTLANHAPSTSKDRECTTPNVDHNSTHPAT
jgi:hypothetical protein